MPLVPNPFTPATACEMCWLKRRNCPFGDRLFSIEISVKFILFISPRVLLNTHQTNLQRSPFPMWRARSDAPYPPYCDIVISVPSSFTGGVDGGGTRGVPRRSIA